MKRKRQCTDDNGHGNGKKSRIEETEARENDEELCEFDTSISKKEEFVLTREVAHNAILRDISGNQWRIGAPIGKGSFGEIYLSSDIIAKPVEINSASYVTKIEPHSNGPLFVEIHCLLNVNKMQQQEQNNEDDDTKIEVLGIPKYIASGSHYFNDSRYRFLIMPRYKADLHSIIKNGRLSRKHFLIIASQIIDVLKNLHEKHYVHSDIKSENIMIGLYDHASSFSAPLTNGYSKKAVKDANTLPLTPSTSSCIQFSGANPLRSCRMKDGRPDKSHHMMYNDMVQSHYLRPGRSMVSYAMDENSRSSHALESEESNDDSDEDEDFAIGSKGKKKKRRSNNKSKRKSPSKSPSKYAPHSQNGNFVGHQHQILQTSQNEDDHVYIIDYGLATKFVDTNGEHRPFCMDQRRAHDGTLEFTSRDAHFGTHSRRSDLECFGYNLIYWSEGYLPWKDEKLKEQPELVHRLKEVFMTDVKEMLKLLYGKEIPKFLGDYMQYVGQLEFDEEPDYDYLRGLFKKEFIKLGYNKSDMKLNLTELRDECESIDKTITEHDLMMSRITDVRTVTKLGFLVSTVDNVDGTEIIGKPNESANLNISMKASPKNLRSKEKDKVNAVGNKRPTPKRQRKITEKEMVNEKMAKGKKLSIHEISLLDPDAIARDRADKEYEKFDEKMQTPQRYTGNPTYAILEIENRLKSKQGGVSSGSLAIHSSCSSSVDVEPIKGYTKSMMEVLKKQQIAVEQQITNSPITQKRSREGLRNVIKPTQKNITYQKQKKKKKSKRSKKDSKKQFVAQIEADVQVPTPVSSKPRRGRAPKRAFVQELQPEKSRNEQEENSSGSSSRTVDIAGKTTAATANRRLRGRPRKNVVIEEVQAEIEEDDSVYYDIPGELSSSSDGVKQISDSELEIDDEIMENDREENVEESLNEQLSDIEEELAEEEEGVKPIIKRLRKRIISNSEDNSNHGSNNSNIFARHVRRRGGRYENDEDFEMYTDEASNVSSATHVSKSSVASSFKPKRARGSNSHDSGIATRNKVKSRSTSRSAAVSEEVSEQSEIDEGSEFEAETEVDESEEEQGIEYDDQEEEEDDEEEVSDETGEERTDDSEIEDSDSIDIKYSPIKTRHARRRINYLSVKQMRRRLDPDVMNEDDVRNFRLVSTRG